MNKTLYELQTTLSGVQETISTQPWMNEKKELISTLREIRNRSPRSESWPEYQKAADVTIRTIAEQVKDQIVRPLEEALHRSPEARQGLMELSRGLVTLRADMDNWEQDHLGKRWYETLFMKDREMRELTYTLESKIDVISTLIRAEQSKIDTKRQELAKLANSWNMISGKGRACWMNWSGRWRRFCPVGYGVFFPSTR